MLLPWWEDQDTRQIVVVPAHLLLAEETHDLVLHKRRVDVELRARYARCGVVRNEEVVEECRDIVEHGFRIKEELGKETQVLRVKLVLFAVDLVKRVSVRRVNVYARWFCTAQWTSSLRVWSALRATIERVCGAHEMFNEACKLFRVLKAPLAHVQALDLATDELLWVERRVPWLDQQRAKHDLEYIGSRRWLVVSIGGRTQGCAILHGHICGHGERRRGRAEVVR